LLNSYSNEIRQVFHITYQRYKVLNIDAPTAQDSLALQNNKFIHLWSNILCFACVECDNTTFYVDQIQQNLDEGTQEILMKLVEPLLDEGEDNNSGSTNSDNNNNTNDAEANNPNNDIKSDTHNPLSTPTAAQAQDIFTGGALEAPSFLTPLTLQDRSGQEPESQWSRGRAGDGDVNRTANVLRTRNGSAPGQLEIFSDGEGGNGNNGSTHTSNNTNNAVGNNGSTLLRSISLGVNGSSTNNRNNANTGLNNGNTGLNKDGFFSNNGRSPRQMRVDSPLLALQKALSPDKFPGPPTSGISNTVDKENVNMNMIGNNSLIGSNATLTRKRSSLHLGPEGQGFGDSAGNTGQSEHTNHPDDGSPTKKARMMNLTNSNPRNRAATDGGEQHSFFSTSRSPADKTQKQSLMPSLAYHGSSASLIGPNSLGKGVSLFAGSAGSAGTSASLGKGASLFAGSAGSAGTSASSSQSSSQSRSGALNNLNNGANSLNHSASGQELAALAEEAKREREKAER
jgi:hypothetical protein